MGMVWPGGRSIYIYIYIRFETSSSAAITPLLPSNQLLSHYTTLHHASDIHPPHRTPHHPRNADHRPSQPQDPPSRRRPQDAHYPHPGNNYHNHNHQDGAHHGRNTPRPRDRGAGAPPQAPCDHGRQGVWRADEVAGKLDAQAWIEGMLSIVLVLGIGANDDCRLLELAACMALMDAMRVVFIKC
jgi:hypothetical protein